MTTNETIDILDIFEKLPLGWTYSTLDQLVDSRGISYGIVQPGSYESNGVPIIRVNNIKNGQFLVDEILKVDRKIEEKYSRTRLRGGEVLLTLVGSLGECAIVPDSMKDWNVARAIGVIPVKSEIGSQWIAFVLRSAPIQHYINTWATTTVQATLNLRDVAKLPIPIPPKSERDKISHILGSLDDKIELNRQMNETLEAIARAIFQSWFVDFDPVRAKAEGRDTGLPPEVAALFPSEFVEANGREVPKGWDVKPLDKIATFLNGLALQKYPPDGDDSLPVIKIAQLHKGDTDGSDRASVNIPSEYVIDDGDVIFSWSGSLEVVIWCGGKGALNQHLFKVTSDTSPKWFYYLWVLHHLPDFQIIAEGKATTMGHIQRHHLSEAMVYVPSEKQIQMMNNMLEPLINKIITNNVQSRTLAQIRDALLPKLMSGEIQLGDIK